MLLGCEGRLRFFPMVHRAAYYAASSYLRLLQTTMNNLILFPMLRTTNCPHFRFVLFYYNQVKSSYRAEPAHANFPFECHKCGRWRSSGYTAVGVKPCARAPSSRWLRFCAEGGDTCIELWDADSSLDPAQIRLSATSSFSTMGEKNTAVFIFLRKYTPRHSPGSFHRSNVLNN